MEDWKENSDFAYTDFISISTIPGSFLRNQIPTADWSSLSPHRSMAFVKLEKGITPAQINRQFSAYIKEHVKLPPGSSLTMQLQALSAINFTNDYYRGR